MRGDVIWTTLLFSETASHTARGLSQHDTCIHLPRLNLERLDTATTSGDSDGNLSESLVEGAGYARNTISSRLKPSTLER